MTALDDYINKVFTLVLLLVPGACQCAGLLYTFEKIIGVLPQVSWTALIIFDITCLIYLATGIYFVKTGSENGVVKPKKLLAGKIFLVVIMFIQYNFILYMIPATDFWGFAFFFVILTSFFLDSKVVAVTAVEIAASIFVSWFINGDIMLPAQNEYFIANLLDRIVCILLSLPTIVLLTYLVKRFLVNAKKDELERNTEQVRNVLSSVQTLSENLFDAGTSLSQISESESASAEKLSTTSEDLLVNSNELEQKTLRSIENLNELNKWEEVVNTNVALVESTSKDNEKLLLSLKNINNEVSESMSTTVSAANNLSAAVEEIGVTLNLISQISLSTHMLSLNASVEAARAGTAGKGFAVVAQEVGNLANSTKNSLEVVENITDKIQTQVAEMKRQVEENAYKLDRQTEYFNNVFEGIQKMVEFLNTMSEAHSNQTEVIKNTVIINKDIADSIQQENIQFHHINNMVESNAHDVVIMNEQVNKINAMVDDINKLLSGNEE